MCNQRFDADDLLLNMLSHGEARFICQGTEGNSDGHEILGLLFLSQITRASSDVGFWG